MCLAWTILQILIFFFYKNLNEFKIDEVIANNANLNNNSPVSNDTITKDYGTINVVHDDINSEDLKNANSINQNEDEIINVNSETDISTNKSQETEKLINRPNVSLRIVDNSESGPLLVRLYNEYVKEEVIAVLCSTFCVFLMQTALEVSCKLRINI